jgi:hypothetical protein
MNTEQKVSANSPAAILRLNAEILATASDLMQLSPEAVFAKCAELNIPVTGDKLKMIDKIVIATYGFDACKRALASYDKAERRKQYLRNKPTVNWKAISKNGP